MCQAYEGEWEYLRAKDKATRRRGYQAHQAGMPRDQCPESDHELQEYSDKFQWELGWDTAAEGREAW